MHCAEVAGNEFEAGIARGTVRRAPALIVCSLMSRTRSAILGFCITLDTGSNFWLVEVIQVTYTVYKLAQARLRA